MSTFIRFEQDTGINNEIIADLVQHPRIGEVCEVGRYVPTIQRGSSLIHFIDTRTYTGAISVVFGSRAQEEKQGIFKIEYTSLDNKLLTICIYAQGVCVYKKIDVAPPFRDYIESDIANATLVFCIYPRQKKIVYDLAKNYVRSINNLYTFEHLKDFTLIGKSKSFRVSKTLLSALSEPLAEIVRNDTTSLELHVSDETTEIFAKMIYQIGSGIGLQEWIELLFLFNKYIITDKEKVAEEKIINLLNIGNLSVITNREFDDVRNVLNLNTNIQAKILSILIENMEIMSKVLKRKRIDFTGSDDEVELLPSPKRAKIEE